MGRCNWEPLHFLRKIYETMRETTGNHRGKIEGLTPFLAFQSYLVRLGPSGGS